MREGGGGGEGGTNDCLVQGCEEDGEHEADKDEDEPVLGQDDLLVCLVAGAHMALTALLQIGRRCGGSCCVRGHCSGRGLSRTSRDGVVLMQMQRPRAMRLSIYVYVGHLCFDSDCSRQNNLAAWKCPAASQSARSPTIDQSPGVRRAPCSAKSRFRTAAAAMRPAKPSLAYESHGIFIRHVSWDGMGWDGTGRDRIDHGVMMWGTPLDETTLLGFRFLG
jgi:hypothetical protein